MIGELPAISEHGAAFIILDTGICLEKTKCTSTYSSSEVTQFQTVIVWQTNCST